MFLPSFITSYFILVKSSFSFHFYCPSDSSSFYKFIYCFFICSIRNVSTNFSLVWYISSKYQKFFVIFSALFTLNNCHSNIFPPLVLVPVLIFVHLFSSRFSFTEYCLKPIHTYIFYLFLQDISAFFCLPNIRCLLQLIQMKYLFRMLFLSFQVLSVFCS